LLSKQDIKCGVRIIHLRLAGDESPIFVIDCSKIWTLVQLHKDLNFKKEEGADDENICDL